MDPFEARLLFSKMLLGLLPSIQVLSKCSAFALRNYEYQDDFHSCVIEVLPTVSTDQRTSGNLLTTVGPQLKIEYVELSRYFDWSVQGLVCKK